MVGFLTDGKKSLLVRKYILFDFVVFPVGTAIIEKYLLSPRESARKRFTIALEGAHDVLSRHIPIHTSPAAAFHSEYDAGMTYSKDMLKKMLNVNECFANRAAACLFMTHFLVERVLKRYNVSKKVIRSDNDPMPSMRVLSS